MSKNSFVKGAFILGIAGVIVKLMGAFFRIPLWYMIGDEGMGYYHTAYPIYVLLLSISTAGFPIAISKMMAERRVVGDHRGAHKVFTTSLKFLSAMGVLTSAVVFLFAEAIVTVPGNPKAVYSMISLAPALLFVPIMATFRGYFQGRNNMTPTAVSQVIEQFFRVAAGLGLAHLLVSKGVMYGAAGASFGASVGAIFGTLFVIFVYMSNKDRIDGELKAADIFPQEKTRAILSNLLVIAVPIIIGSLVLPIMNLIDLGLVMRRLVASGYTPEAANELYGQLSGRVNTIINLPQIMTISVAVSSVPVISECFKLKDMEGVRKNARMAIRLTTLIGLPAAVGLMVLPNQIIQLLYGDSSGSAGQLLFIMAFGVYFLSLVQAFVGILQGVSRSYVPVINLMIAVVFKTICTFILTAIPGINIKGAAIGTVIAYMIAFALDLLSVRKYLRMRFSLRSFVVMPLIASVPMGIAAKLSYHLFANVIGGKLASVMGGRIPILLAVGVGVLVYGVILIATGGVTKEELKKFPGGKRILRFLPK